MRPRVIPFEANHIEGAALLLSQRCRADRLRDPMLSARFESEEARVHLEEVTSRSGACGVAAFSDNSMVGYLVGAPNLLPPTHPSMLYIRPRSVLVPYGGHAAAESDMTIYRWMYAALAAQWVAAGYFTHYVWTSAVDERTAAAWASLGFGGDVIKALATTERPGPDTETEPPLEIRRADVADFDAVMPMVLDNLRYHASSPIFFPYLGETADEVSRFYRDLMADSESAVWLVIHDGEPVGVQMFRRPNDEVDEPQRCAWLDQAYVKPFARSKGLGTALLWGSMKWARDSGYAYCKVFFMPTNLVSAGFWLSRGFRPRSRRLARHVDERVSWAYR